LPPIFRLCQHFSGVAKFVDSKVQYVRQFKKLNNYDWKPSGGSSSLNSGADFNAQPAREEEAEEEEEVGARRRRNGDLPSN
jgi:hypothetical protein